MASIKYNGNIVNPAVSNIKDLSNEFSSLSNSIKSATNMIVSARGFQQYVGGISSDTFSSDVAKCGEAVDGLVNDIRQKQVSILAYSEDKAAINAFLDTLDRKDYNSLDLSSIDSYIGLDRKILNLFKGIGSTAATAGLGLVQGLGEFLETGADLLTMGKSAVLSIFTGAYDLLTGSHTTRDMWEETKAQVSEKKVESIFNSFYDNNPIGQAIKNNAYGFDVVRGVTSGLGYVGGLIGLNIVTGGLASGLGVGAAGSVGAGQLALSAGLFGVSSGSEDAWADGASLGKGLLYGAANGVWEGAQWFAGAKINQIGGLGDKIANGIFKGAAGGVGIRIGLDTIDSGLEGFVRPALNMIYKDYGNGTLVDKYKTAFESEGGWGNVLTSAIIGGIGSAASEFIGARKFLKEAKGASEQANKEALAGGFGDDPKAKTIFASDAASDYFDDEIYGSSKYGRTARTIDGDWIRDDVDHVFNSRPKDVNIPDSYKYFGDGSFIPDSKNFVEGILGKYEGTMTADEMINTIKKNSKNLSASEYTRLMDVANIFKSEGLDINANELKLIINHSEGNLGRIKDAIKLTSGGLGDDKLDSVSRSIVDKIFNPNSNNGKVYRNVTSKYIDSLRQFEFDDWKSAKELYDNINADKLFKVINNRNSALYEASISKYFGGQLDNATVKELAQSDGYLKSVKDILKTDSNINDALQYMTQQQKNEFLDELSVGVASKVFKHENLARFKATKELTDNFNFKDAIKLTSNSSDIITSHYELFKATDINKKASRFSYYSLVDGLKDMGYSEDYAVKTAKDVYVKAMQDVGVDVDTNKLFNTKSNLFMWNDDIIDVFSNERFSSPGSGMTSDFLRKNYLTADGGVKASKLISDFDTVMKKSQNLSSDFLKKHNFDANETKAASELFMKAYKDAAVDVNNPNRAEALRFMSKIVELDSQGKTIIVGSDFGDSVSHSKNKTGVINLANYTLWGKNSDTVLHETGHAIFSVSFDEQLPKGFESIRRRAMENLESNNSQMILKLFDENTKEASMYADYLAKQQFDTAVRSQGADGLKGYRNRMANKYSSFSLSDRASTLKNRTTRAGMITGKSFEKDFAQKLDFKDCYKISDIEVNSMVARARDKVMRDKFADYTIISGIIDTTSHGDVRFSYGHGSNYFMGKRIPEMIDTFTYHELMADYSDLKVSGRNSPIRFLRLVFGDELFDTVDDTYYKMLR